MKTDIIKEMLNKKKQQNQEIKKKDLNQLGEGAQFIIKRNSLNILNPLLVDLNDFSQAHNEKYKSINVLKYLVLACKNDLQEQSEKILSSLYKNSDHEEENIRELIKEVSSLIGEYFDMEALIPIISKSLLDNDIKANNKSIVNRFHVLSSIFHKSTSITHNSLQLFFNTLRELDLFVNYYSNNVIFIYLYEILSGIISSISISNIDKRTFLKDFHSEIFYYLLLLFNFPILPKEIRDKVPSVLLTLSTLLGFNDIDGLYSLELSFILDKFKDSHKLWRRNTADRYAFDAFVKHAGESLNSESGDNWIKVLEIISNCTEANKDIEMRMDMLILIETLIEISSKEKELSCFVFFSEFVIEQILIPASMWKAQRPNYNIRKVGIICMIKMYKYNMIESTISQKYFSSYITMLKSSMEDDWDCELRNLSIQFVNMLLSKNNEKEYSNSFLSESELRELYPLMLKRLDDSQDENRKSICKGFVLFFYIVKDKIRISTSAIEYIFQNSCIHLDDSNVEIRKNVYEFLEILFKISIDEEKYKKTLFKITEVEIKRFQHKDYISKLWEIIQS